MVLLILHFDSALWFSLQTRREGNNVSPNITEVAERLQSFEIATCNDLVNSKQLYPSCSRFLVVVIVDK
jgi:hypothetical protein